MEARLYSVLIKGKQVSIYSCPEWHRGSYPISSWGSKFWFNARATPVPNLCDNYMTSNTVNQQIFVNKFSSNENSPRINASVSDYVFRRTVESDVYRCSNSRSWSYLATRVDLINLISHTSWCPATVSQDWNERRLRFQLLKWLEPTSLQKIRDSWPPVWCRHSKTPLTRGTVQLTQMKSSEIIRGHLNVQSQPVAMTTPTNHLHRTLLSEYKYTVISQRK